MFSYAISTSILVSLSSIGQISLGYTNNSFIRSVVFIFIGDIPR
jgi:hypothetical protein